jgi:carbonic anhydrase
MPGRGGAQGWGMGQMTEAGPGDPGVPPRGPARRPLDDQVVLGSIEFGPVNYDSARLMFVLGHQNCGAVKAAIEFIGNGSTAPGHIQAVVDALRPAYQAAKPQPGDMVDKMVRAQIRLTVRQLKQDPQLSKQMIVGGYYQLASGVIEIIT